MIPRKCELELPRNLPRLRLSRTNRFIVIVRPARRLFVRLSQASERLLTFQFAFPLAFLSTRSGTRIQCYGTEEAMRSVPHASYPQEPALDMHPERILQYNHQLRQVQRETHRTKKVYLIPFLVRSRQPAICVLDNFLHIPNVELLHRNKK